MVRRFDITNLSAKTQEVRLFFHHNFHVGGSENGDTAFYTPQRRTDHSLPSGIMAEQLHPVSAEPISVSPLTWSRASYAASVLACLEARSRLT